MQSSFKLLLSFVLIIILSSCFALQNFSDNKKTIQSFTLDTIIINPSAVSKKKLYITFTNSTIYDKFELEKEIQTRFEAKGFTVLKTPNEAPILLNVNLRYYGIFEKEVLNAMLEDKTKKDFITGSSEFQDFQRTSSPKVNVDFSGFIIGGVAGFLLFHDIGLTFISAIAFAGIGMFLEGVFEPRTVVAMVDATVSEHSPRKIKTYDFRQIKLGDGGVRKTEL